jgi:hypothetical protein
MQGAREACLTVLINALSSDSPDRRLFHVTRAKEPTSLHAAVHSKHSVTNVKVFVGRLPLLFEFSMVPACCHTARVYPALQSAR